MSYVVYYDEQMLATYAESSEFDGFSFEVIGEHEDEIDAKLAVVDALNESAQVLHDDMEEAKSFIQEAKIGLSIISQRLGALDDGVK